MHRLTLRIKPIADKPNDITELDLSLYDYGMLDISVHRDYGGASDPEYVPEADGTFLVLFEQHVPRDIAVAKALVQFHGFEVVEEIHPPQ